MVKVILFNFLDKKNFGVSVVEVLLIKEVYFFGELLLFDGVGIYVIYYMGDFEVYEWIIWFNNDGKFMLFIYVGKVVFVGVCMGVGIDILFGKVFFKRFKEYVDSIKVVMNLNVEDFFC